MRCSWAIFCNTGDLVQPGETLQPTRKLVEPPCDTGSTLTAAGLQNTHRPLPPATGSSYRHSVKPVTPFAHSEKPPDALARSPPGKQPRK